MQNLLRIVASSVYSGQSMTMVAAFQMSAPALVLQCRIISYFYSGTSCIGVHASEGIVGLRYTKMVQMRQMTHQDPARWTVRERYQRKILRSRRGIADGHQVEELHRGDRRPVVVLCMCRFVACRCGCCWFGRTRILDLCLLTPRLSTPKAVKLQIRPLRFLHRSFSWLPPIEVDFFRQD